MLLDRREVVIGVRVGVIELAREGDRDDRRVAISRDHIGCARVAVGDGLVIGRGGDDRAGDSEDVG